MKSNSGKIMFCKCYGITSYVNEYVQTRKMVCDWGLLNIGSCHLWQFKICDALELKHSPF